VELMEKLDKNNNIDYNNYNDNNSTLNKDIIKTPSKVILFGEHGVVDGYGAISMAINLKTTGKIMENNKNKITINLKDIGKEINLNIKDIPKINLNNCESDLKYVIGSLKFIMNYLINNKNINSFKPFKLDISSEIPISCGLGSSASVIITAIRSFLYANDLSLSNKDLLKIAFSVEKEVQGRASITDTATIIHGGPLRIKDNNNFEELNNSELYNLLKKCEFLIVHVEKRRKKTAQLVNEVAKHPKKIEIFKEIGNIVNKVQYTSSYEGLGNLMVKNHNLLKKLGVSTNKIDKVVEIGSNYGYGAKLSGAGGGGITIILVDKNKKKELLESLNKLGVLGIFNCKIEYNRT